MSDYYIRQAGVYTGIVDGDFGKGSFNAVKTFIDKSDMVATPVPVPSINEPTWIIEARKHIGLKEIKGSGHNPTILGWIKNLGGFFDTDEVPWCGTFVAQCLTKAERGVPKHWYRALAYQSYGTKLSKPAYGSIGVMGRKGGGHVTFIVGETRDGQYLLGLGGNQSDAVNLMKFPKSRFTAWVWPTYKTGVMSSPYPDRYNLPVYDNNMRLSTKES